MTTSVTADSHMQESVFAFLTDPATHPNVDRIDTHAASVFLEGDRALKIKRAVQFPYLDYSTLEKRKAACDEEMKVNRQFANLPSRGPDHPERRRIARYRRNGYTGRICR
jgi:aminoglycoside phosphotransferase family enzyme